ncbi:putative ABC transporter ATP-binding protein [Halobacteriovorax marinus SJ]|uniref:ABC transporter ATP-binding protein n=1 Tax=Halobacteriovorax marinus (strain ATCC BAA-682 / DSM 15412 / SJ) TaxID=862908 RepID=E1X5P5_HALMS|nr:ABC transporter ATP-binding protein [Halobacteriovorax marinus]CBW25612.1 putative ABC transporter ATP-binding protein [Halobacteriovorax marinus SJ]
MEEKAIRVENVHKSYSSTNALNGVTFEVSKGSIHGFLGPNGAGKSTTMKILTKELTLCSGEVTINSEKPIGFLPEIPPLYKHMTVSNYLEFVRDIFNSRSDLSEICTRCGLSDVSHRLIGNLSKGYQQRVGIAQALVVDPEIIILDEPTVGLDPHAIKEIRELILSLKKDHTILFSTHQLYEASHLCDEVTIINHGKILKTGKIEDVKNDLVAGEVILIELDSKLSDEDRSECISKFNVEISGKENQLRIVSKEKADLRGEINRFLLDKNYIVSSLKSEEMDLEQIFQKVTSNIND